MTRAFLTLLGMFALLPLTACPGSSSGSDTDGGSDAGASDAATTDRGATDAGAEAGMDAGGDGAAACVVSYSFSAKNLSADANLANKTFAGDLLAMPYWNGMMAPGRISLDGQKVDKPCVAISVMIDGAKPAMGSAYTLGVKDQLASFVYQENAVCDYTPGNTLTWGNAALNTGTVTFTKVDGTTWEGTFTVDLTANALSKMAKGTFTLEGTFKTTCATSF